MGIRDLISTTKGMVTTHQRQEESDITHLEKITACPRCGKHLVPTPAINGSESSFFKECPSCGTLVNTYKPLKHQADFLSNPCRFKMAAGGYGCGKSATNIQYVVKHMLLIPKARVCVAARTYPALESTFLEEFKGLMPNKLVKGKNEQKHEYYLTNGSTLMLRSFDDPTKLKSMNLTLAVIVEASDVPESGLDMFKSRIRNNAAMLPMLDSFGEPIREYDEETDTFKIRYRADARHILLETNPASNWVKKFLQDSGSVQYYGSARNEGYRMSADPVMEQYTQVISTDTNPYLPSDYIPNLCKNKSPAWVAQFVRGSFNFNDNLVFPNAGLCIKERHPLPREFDETGKRVLWYTVGLDYGINDPTHIIFMAFSTEEHKLYVFNELRMTQCDVKNIANEYRRELKILQAQGIDIRHNLFMLPRFDGRSYNKRESDLHTIGGAFEAEGLYFEPSFASHEIRIIKTNSLINHGQLEIFGDCEYLINELLNYTFAKDKYGNATSRPEDGNDHGITAMEFVIADLPYNLTEINMSAYLPTGMRIEHDKQADVDEKANNNDQAYFNPFKEVSYDNRNTDPLHRRCSAFANGISDDVLSFEAMSPMSGDGSDGDQDGQWSDGGGFYLQE